MADHIKVFLTQPFTSAFQCGLNDVFDGDGVTDTFTLSNKTNATMGATVQADSVQYYYYNGGFTKSGSYDFTLSSAPVSGSIIVSPSYSYLNLVAFDQTTVGTNTEANVFEKEFYIGEVDDIHLNKLITRPDEIGIKLQFYDHIDGEGATVLWVQLACAAPDEDGVALTYADAGDAVYTDNIQAFSTLAASSASGSTTIVVASADDAATFVIGDYIMINRGGGSQEIVKLLDIVDDTLTITGLTADHFSTETVYACARKFWAKLTVPEDATNNTAQNYWDIALNIIGAIESRV